MKIASFSVSRYRSIIEAEKISIGDITILIGRNNEGKSNILKALNTAISAIRHHSTHSGRIVRPGRAEHKYRTMFGFDWEVDFPIPLQDKTSGNKKTRFRIDFELNDNENSEFQAIIGSNSNGVLPIEILVGEDGGTDFSFLKPGKGSKAYSSKSREICSFISSRIDFVYVPAVRTESDALDVIRSRFRKLLDSLESNPEYKAAVDAIQNIQKPLLDQLASDVRAQLVRFIPSVSNVEIDTSERRIYSNLSSSVEMTIDDGVATSLEAKGDGIKSLVALSLFNSTPSPGRSRIIAIEEPESHLHSGAVHELRRVLNQLSQDGQVLISTHTAAFVDRQRLANVILVEKGKAEKAKSVSRIRESLGILVSDNLINADFSVICEGTSDARILASVLSGLSQKIRAAVQSGSLIFDQLGGASNLSYKISSLNREVFETFSVLDFDDSGKKAISDSTAKGLIGVADYALVRLRGNMESEIEDAVDSTLLKPFILQRFGVDIGGAGFGGSAKFGGRLKSGFEAAGKLWSDELEMQIKTAIADFVEEKPLERLTTKGRDFFQSVAVSIESKMRDVS